MNTQLFERLAKKMVPHARLLRIWEMEGGVSAQVTGMEIEQPDGHTKKMIVRQHGAADLQRDPEVAKHEYKLLYLLHSTGLPVPAPCFVDESGEILSSPCLVIEYVENERDYKTADLYGYVDQLAVHLAAIHQADLDLQGLGFLPDQTKMIAAKLADRPVCLDETLSEGRLRDVLDAVWPLPPRNTSVLLHGDYWPGNTLWKDNKLVAVIDWEDAAIGDPLADLANARLEMLWAFGTEAMHDFTTLYKSRMRGVDVAHLPYWDLCAALRPASKLSQWGLEASVEQKMRQRHAWFVNQALEKLSVQM